MRNQAHLMILSKNKNVRLARLTAAAFASELDFTINEIEEIKVAVSEVVTNCIIHGYPDREDKIDINMVIINNSLEITVTDYGVGIKDIEKVLQPSDTTKIQHMGLASIDSFMDNIEIESDENVGTIVTMDKVPKQIKK